MVHESFTHSEITEQVNKITKSSILKNSPVLCQFLQFVVDETLEGKGDRIKEYTIGTQVLGRKSDFDPQLDAIVRIHAGRLRRALNEFYSGEGKGDVMRITIPKGGYTPEFLHNGYPEKLLQTSTTVETTKSGKPVVAVMPFRNMSNNPSHDFFCNSLGEFSSTELARFPELSLISYSSCTNAAGKTKDICEMGSLLGAEYILTGSIFIDHKNLRMPLQLSRGDSGKQLWSGTFESKISATNHFEIQEEIINLITASIGGYFGAIYRDVVEASQAKGDFETFSAIVWYDYFLKRLDKNTFDQACESLEDTVKNYPDNALAWAVLSDIYGIGVRMGGELRLHNQIETALNFAKRATRIDPMCQHAYQALARGYLMTGDRNGVVSAGERCISINPRAVSFVPWIGIFMIYAGEYERGATILKNSMQLNPYFPWISYVALSLYHYQRGEYKESREWAIKLDSPNIPWIYMLKAASMAQTGQLDMAKKKIALLLASEPDITQTGRAYIRSIILDESLVDKIVSGLEKAGLSIN